MMAPRVSVICTFLNAERFLAEAIDSVLAQDFRDFELLLIDDGSTDASSTFAKAYAADDSGRIRYLEHAGHANLGASPSRNLGWKEAQGEFVAFIDSDDVWRPSKLGEQVAILESKAEAGMVCGAVNYWSSWAAGKDRLVPTGSKRNGLSQPSDTVLEVYPLGDAHAPCPSDVLIRRAILDGRPFEDRFVGPAQIYEDQVLFAKVYLAAPVYFSTSVWLDYRQHPDSCVSTVARSGLYSSIRRDFLDWLADYVRDRDFPVNDRIMKRIERARHELSHPLSGRFRRTYRRLRAVIAR